MKTAEIEVLLKEKEETIEELQRDKQCLLERLSSCEDYISSQVNEMRKISSYISLLSRNGKRYKYQRSGRSTCKQVSQLKSKMREYKERLACEEEEKKALLEQLENEKMRTIKLEDAFAKTVNTYRDVLSQNEYPASAEEITYLQNENCQLNEEIQDLRCGMQEQTMQIRSLARKIENITKEHKERENCLNVKIAKMQNYISECEQKLADVQVEEQKRSEEYLREKMSMLDRIESLETQVRECEATISAKVEANRVLLEKLEQEQCEKAAKERALDTVNKNYEISQQMLSQARNTIQCVTQKLEEYDIERLQTQRGAQIKISELEGQLVIANATIQKLRENLNEMKGVMDRNVALRTLSAQLHEAANIQVTKLEDANGDMSKRSKELSEMNEYLKGVIYEKDKTFDELRSHLNELKRQLECEQRLRENTETVLADVTASGESELANLRNVVSVLNGQLNRLHLEKEHLMNTSTVGIMKTRIKSLEDENQQLLSKVKRFADYLQKILPGYVKPQELAKMKMQMQQMGLEIEQQKREIEMQTKMRTNVLIELSHKLEEQEEIKRKLVKLQEENEDLKCGIPPAASPLKTVVFVEKEKDARGAVRYRYLGGVEQNTAEYSPQYGTTLEKYKPIASVVDKSTATVDDQQDETTSTIFDPQSKSEAIVSSPSQEKIAFLQQQIINATNDISFLRNQIVKNTNEIYRLKTPPEDELVLSSNIVEFVPEVDEQSSDYKVKRETSPPESVKNEVFEMFESEKDSLAQQIENQKREIKELIQKLQDAKDPNAPESELERVKEENRKLKAMLEGTDVEKAPYSDISKLKELEDALRAAENQCNNLKLNEEALERENKKLRSELDENREKQSSKTALPSSVLSTDSILDFRRLSAMYEQGQITKDEHIKELEERSKLWQKGYEKEIGKLRQEIDSLKKKGPLLAEGCDKHQAIIDDLQKKLEEQKAMAQEGITEMNEFMAEFKIDKDQPGSKDKAEIRKMRNLLEHMRNLQQKNEKLKTKNIQLELDHNKMKKDVERVLGRDLDSFEAEMQRLRDLEKELEKFKYQYEKMRKQYEEMVHEEKTHKKEYIDVLIAKEKLALQLHDLNRRLREINKLLIKCQEKNGYLKNRIIKMNEDKEQLEEQLNNIQNKEVKDLLQKVKETDELKGRNSALETEVEEMRIMFLRLHGKTTPDDRTDEAQLGQLQHVLDVTRENEKLKLKICKLELDIENLQKEMENYKDTISHTSGSPSPMDIQNMKEQEVEYKIQNEFLKNELDDKEQTIAELRNENNKIQELEEENKKLGQNIDHLKRINIDLELDIEHLKKELLDTLEKRDDKEDTEQNSELIKQIHNLKMKNDNLQYETLTLKKQMEKMGQEKISLESHTCHTLLKNIQRIMHSQQLLPDPKNTNITSSKDIEQSLNQWKEEFDKQLQNLKEDLDLLIKKDKGSSEKLTDELQAAAAHIKELQKENTDMKIIYNTLVKNEDAFSVKLDKKVKEYLQDFKEAEELREAYLEQEKTIEKLEEQLGHYKKICELLEKEQVSLESHIQSERIKDLESAIEEHKLYYFSKGQHTPIKGKRSVLFDVANLKVSELEKEIEQLTEHNSEIEAEAQKLREAKEKLESELEESIKENNELNAEISKLQDQINELKDRSRKVTFDKEAHKNQQLLKELEELKANYLLAYEQLEQAQNRIEELEDQLAKCRNINRSLKKQLNLNEDSNDASREGSYSESTDQGPNKGQKSNITDELQKMKERLRAANTKYREAKLELDKLRTLSSSKTKYGSKLKGIEEELRRSQATNEKFKSQLREEASSKVVIMLENESFKQDNKSLKEELNNLQQATGELLKKIQKQHEEALQLKRGIFTLGEDNSKLLQLLKKSKMENKELLDVVSNLEKQIQQEEGKGDINEEKVKSLQEILHKYQDSNQFLKITIIQLQKEKTDLRTELYRLKNSKYTEEKGQQTDTTEDRKDDNQYKDMKSTIDTLQYELHCMKKNMTIFMEQKSTKHVTNAEAQTEQKIAKVATATTQTEQMLAKTEEVQTDLQILKLHEDEDSQQLKLKDIVARLTKQYEENIKILNDEMPLPSPVRKNPWVVQVPAIQTGYIIEPVLWQMPVVTNKKYEIVKIQHEQAYEIFNGLEELADLVDKIKETFNNSKRVFGAKDQPKKGKMNVSEKNRRTDVSKKSDTLDFGQIIQQRRISKIQKSIQETINQLKGCQKSTLTEGSNNSGGKKVGFMVNKYPYSPKAQGLPTMKKSQTITKVETKQTPSITKVLFKK